MDVELLPCPWCRSLDITKTDDGHKEWLRCEKCGATGPWIEPPDGHEFTGSELVDQWNTRSTPKPEPSSELGWVVCPACKGDGGYENPDESRAALSATSSGVDGAGESGHKIADPDAAFIAAALDFSSGGPDTFTPNWLTYRDLAEAAGRFVARIAIASTGSKMREALVNCMALVRLKYGNMDEGANAVLAQADEALRHQGGGQI